MGRYCEAIAINIGGSRLETEWHIVEVDHAFGANGTAQGSSADGDYPGVTFASPASARDSGDHSNPSGLSSVSCHRGRRSRWRT